MTPDHPAARLARAIALLFGVAAVLGTVTLYVAERYWSARNVTANDPKAAFADASIGTELAPLAAFVVLPDLFPDEFQPLKGYFARFGRTVADPGDWVQQYGFVRGEGKLPVGFVTSYHRPGSGAGSPVEFVGLSCAACHSAEIQTDPDVKGTVLIGVGNPSMNLLAFSEAVRGALVKRTNPADPTSDYVLSVAAVDAARKNKGLPPLTLGERAMTFLWLTAARGETAAYQRVIDDPFDAGQLLDPRYIAAGPIRTQPFRSLVRVHLDRPGMSAAAQATDHGFSKIPVVFHQDPEFHGPWAQFDGSAGDLTARSTLAASTAGANVNNLSLPDLSEHIKLAAAFTRNPPVPAWDTVLPAHKRTPEQRELADIGKVVYTRECYGCHGGPAGTGWTWDKGSRFGTVAPIDQIGTDRERIAFRHKHEIPQVVADKFRKPEPDEAPFAADFRRDHPLATFTEKDLQAPEGYYCGPISGAFMRAPYLHNASILTLAELIGLEPRRPAFYRGRNAYDPERVGFKSPPVPAGVGHANPVPHDKHLYSVFDTTVRGNSNAGHYYPTWGRWSPDRTLTDAQKAELAALLEYLKGL